MANNLYKIYANDHKNAIQEIMSSIFKPLTALENKIDMVFKPFTNICLICTGIYSQVKCIRNII